MKEKIIKIKDQITLFFENIKISKKTANICIYLSITILVLLFTYKIGNYFNSPKYIAQNYFEKIINNDINGIFKYFSTESTFVTKDILKEKIDILENVDDYKIETVEKNNREALIVISYYLENDSKEYFAYVRLYKNRKNKFLFYDNWKIDSGKLANDIKINVPIGSSIKIDNKDITDFKSTKLGDEFNDVYQINNMITGTYEIEITLKNGIVITEKIDIEDNITYKLGNIDLPQDKIEILENMTLSNIQTLYNGSINNTTYNDLKNNLTNINTNNIEDQYINLKRKIQNSIIKYNEIKVENIKIKKAYYNNGKLEVNMEITHHNSGTGASNEIYKKTDLKTNITVIFNELENQTFQIDNIIF